MIGDALETAEERCIMVSLTYPIKDIEFVLRACDPNEPLPPGDPRYHDFKPLRWISGVAQMNRILSVPPAEGDFHHRVLCGHRGSGKSTELLHLKEWADANGFLTVRVEVDMELGLIDLEFSDLYLLTAMEVEKAMREFQSPLPPEAVRQVIQWFAERIREEKETANSELAVEAGVQLESGIPLLGKLFAKFCSAVKASSQHVLTVRQRLRDFPDTLIDYTNELLRVANKALHISNRPGGLLLLFDNLDRYMPEQIDRLLMRGSTLMRRLACHAVYTMPIALEYSPLSGPIQDEYDPPFVLPMLTLRQPSDHWAATVADSPFDEEAVAGVIEAMRKRIDVDALFEQPEDAELLVKMSGGCVRDLLHLVTLTFGQADDRFNHAAVTGAIKQYRATFVRRLMPDDYKRLACIARREPTPRDALTARLLFHRFALEYYDRDGKVWIDVHPLIIETEELQREIQSRSLIARG
jgi:hypothetical protein